MALMIGDGWQKQKQILRSPPPNGRTFGAPFSQNDTTFGGVRGRAMRWPGLPGLCESVVVRAAEVVTAVGAHELALVAGEAM